MHELTITRLIDADPAIVWKTMIERFGDWWCPRPWRAEIVEWNRRPGGRADTVMYGPDGEVNHCPGVFLAWDEGRRFAMTDAIVGDLEPATPFMIGIWEITPEGKAARYVARARHWTEDAMIRHRDMGFEAGWSTCAAQLAELCES